VCGTSAIVDVRRLKVMDAVICYKYIVSVADYGASVLGEKPFTLPLFKHKSHIYWPGVEPGSPRCEACN